MANHATKDKIIAASWELLASSNLTEFSMRKLSDKLEMTVSSLYYHFKNKEALFAALIDKATIEILFPVDEKTWQNRLFQYGKNIYQTLENYPNLAQLLTDYPPQSENYLRLLDKLLMILDDISLADQEKFAAINLFLNFIYSSKIDSERFATNENSSDLTALAQIAPFLSKYWKSETLATLGTTESFEFGLRLLISGIEKIQKTS